MKRQAVTLDALADRPNLALAAWKAAQGKRHRPAVARFMADLDTQLAGLGCRIRASQVPSGAASRFTIHDPKRREISAACFEDRVLHHAILNLTEARFERALVDSVYACRSGLGVHAAVAAVQRGLQRHAWVVQVDVKGYFASIDHGLLLAQLARRFKGADFLALLERVVRGMGPGGPRQDRMHRMDAAADPAVPPGKGLPIGALTSQHFANGFLDPADRWLLAQPGVQAHVRYMDDIVWFCADRASAQATLAGLRRLLADDLLLQLKSRVVLRPCAEGLLFCGFRIRPGVVLAGRRKLKRLRQAAGRLQASAARADVTDRQRQRALDVAVAATLPAETRRLRERLWGGRPHEPRRYVDGRTGSREGWQPDGTRG